MNVTVNRVANGTGETVAWSVIRINAGCAEKLAEFDRVEDACKFALVAEGLVAAVEVRNVYGNEMIYPANFAAERFAAIAGKKTLSRADLTNIKGLGFAVEEVATKKLAA